MTRRRTITGLLAAMVIAGGLLLGVTGTARADVNPASGSWYEIYNPYTSNPACVDGSSSVSGSQLWLWHCHGYDSQGAPQRWYFTAWPGIAHAYVITNAAGYCITANGYTAGSRLKLNRCIIGPYWIVLSRNAYPGDPVFRLEFETGGNCMGITDLSGNNGVPVVLVPCSPVPVGADLRLG